MFSDPLYGKMIALWQGVAVLKLNTRIQAAPGFQKALVADVVHIRTAAVPHLPRRDTEIILLSGPQAGISKPSKGLPQAVQPLQLLGRLNA